jgi:hypothetical protein
LAGIPVLITLLLALLLLLDAVCGLVLVALWSRQP